MVAKFTEYQKGNRQAQAPNFKGSTPEGVGRQMLKNIVIPVLLGV